MSILQAHLKIVRDAEGNISKRTLVLSKQLAKENKVQSKTDVKNKDNTLKDSIINNASPVGDKKIIEKPIIQIIAPENQHELPKGKEKEPPKDKVILENVKEQSLEGEGQKNGAVLSTEPIKKLKEKIIGTPSEEEHKEGRLFICTHIDF